MRLRRRPTVRSVREGFDASNSIAAQIISQDTARYPPGSLAQQWALAYMARVERDAVARIGPLFAQRKAA